MLYGACLSRSRSAHVAPATLWLPLFRTHATVRLLASTRCAGEWRPPLSSDLCSAIISVYSTRRSHAADLDGYGDGEDRRARLIHENSPSRPSLIERNASRSVSKPSAFATIACPAELALCSSASTVSSSQSRCLYEHTDRPHPVVQTPAGLRAIGPSIRKVYLAHRVRDGPVTMRGGEAKSGPALLASVNYM